MENNFTKMPHELMDLLMNESLNETERRILLFMARKIYGFNKDSDRISNSQIEKKLNLAHSTVSLALSRMKLVGIVKLVESGKSRKEPSKWAIDLSNLDTKLVGIVKLVRYDRQKLVGIVDHTIESITKEKLAGDFSNNEHPANVYETNSKVAAPSNNEEAWEKLAPGIITELKISDPYFIDQVKSDFVSKAKRPTENAIRAFVKSAMAKNPPAEYVSDVWGEQ